MTKRFRVLISVKAFFILSLLALCCSGCTGQSGNPAPAPDPKAFDLFSISPISNAKRVPVNATVTAGFTEDVDPASVTAAGFVVTDGAGSAVAGNLSVSGAMVTFSPVAELLTSTTYTVLINTSITNTSGKKLARSYSWSFTTNFSSDYTAPSAFMSTPEWEERDVPTDIVLKVTFSEPMDPATINSSTFTVRTYSSWVLVNGTITYSGTTAVFTPAAPLADATTYKVIVDGATDLAGNPLSSSVYDDFTTADPGSHHLFSYYQRFLTGSWPEAVAIGDVNHDGRNDVVMVTSYSFDPDNDYCLFVFHQNASGKLDPPIKYRTSGDFFHPPKDVAVGDMNNDGLADVVVANSGGSLEVFLQDAFGNLVSSATYSTVNSYKIRLADLNNDGRLDVVGIGYANDAADVLLQNNKGGLDPPVTYAVGHEGDDDLEVGDANNDGLVDVVVMSQNSLAPNISVLPQLAAGTLGAPQGYDVYFGLDGHSLVDGVAVGDVNGDGRADVVVTHEANQPDSYIAIFPQNAGGTLDPAMVYDSYGIAGSAEVADVNGDGRGDIIVVHDGAAVGIYLQASDGTLLPEERYVARAYSNNRHGVSIGDINGDGKNDIVLADYHSGIVVLYHK